MADTGGRKKKRTGQDPRRACARKILEAVPPAMWFLRGEIGREAGEGLSLPQFRVLAFLSRSPGASLSALADFTGVADATASATVERLVRRGLVARRGDPSERRKVVLDLTADGAALLERARERARRAVAKRLAHLSEAKLAALKRGLELMEEALGRPFDPDAAP